MNLTVFVPNFDLATIQIHILIHVNKMVIANIHIHLVYKTKLVIANIHIHLCLLLFDLKDAQFKTNIL